MDRIESRKKILNQYKFRNHSLSEDYADLVERDYNSKYGIYVPDAENNISFLYQFISDVSRHEKKTVVLALDAISYNYYINVMRQYIPENTSKFERVLSSVFPSTTSSAWSSVITGEIPGVHVVYGTSYRINPEQTYVWLNDVVSNKTEAHTEEGKKLFSDGCTPLFSAINNKIKIYIGRHGHSERNSFFHSMTIGIDERIFPDLSTYISMKYKPDELVEYIYDNIQKKISSNEEMFVWAYFDFDDFIHEKGYDDLNYIWEPFFDRLAELVEEADSVILIADHGQTIQNQWETSVLSESQNDIFSLKICGAGRVLYLYGDDKKALYNWAVDYYQNHAAVLTREEAIDIGLFPEKCYEEERIGDVIVIGKDSQFHSIGASYVYEHGACTEDEMFVPAVLFEKKKKDVYFFCDLCDVLITGLESITGELAKHLKLDEATIEQQLFNHDYNDLWKGKVSEKDFFKRLIKGNGWDMDVDDFCTLIREGFREIPGVREIYQELGLKYNMILVSVNIPEWVQYMKDKIAYESLFRDGIFYSYELGYTKREKECFTYLMELYDIEPDQVVYIDDSRSCIGIAEELGIKGVHFENAEQLRKALATYL